MIQKGKRIKNIKIKKLPRKIIDIRRKLNKPEIRLGEGAGVYHPQGKVEHFNYVVKSRSASDSFTIFEDSAENLKEIRAANKDKLNLKCYLVVNDRMYQPNMDPNLYTAIIGLTKTLKDRQNNTKLTDSGKLLLNEIMQEFNPKPVANNYLPHLIALINATTASIKKPSQDTYNTYQAAANELFKTSGSKLPMRGQILQFLSRLADSIGMGLIQVSAPVPYRIAPSQLGNWFREKSQNHTVINNKVSFFKQALNAKISEPLKSKIEPKK